MIKLSWGKFFQVFRQKIKRAVIFVSFCPSSWNGIVKLLRLRAFQRHMACPIVTKKSGSSHLYCGDAKPGCPDSLPAGIIESSNIFVLHRILVKLHIRTRLIESFSTTYDPLSCAEEKLLFTPVHTLRHLKRDEGLFPPLGRVIEFRARHG